MSPVSHISVHPQVKGQPRKAHEGAPDIYHSFKSTPSRTAEPKKRIRTAKSQQNRKGKQHVPDTSKGSSNDMKSSATKAKRKLPSSYYGDDKDDTDKQKPKKKGKKIVVSSSSDSDGSMTDMISSYTTIPGATKKTKNRLPSSLYSGSTSKEFDIDISKYVLLRRTIESESESDDDDLVAVGQVGSCPSDPKKRVNDHVRTNTGSAKTNRPLSHQEDSTKKSSLRQHRFSGSKRTCVIICV